MKSAIKGVKIAAVVIYVLALILNFVGTIFMFMDYRYYYRYYDYYYYKNPEAGVMPLCAFILTVIALIFVCCSGKKPKLLIGTLVLFVPIELLLGLSIFLVLDNGIIGYIICIPAIGLVFIGFILSIVLMIMNSSEAKKKKAVSSEKTVVKKEAAREIRAIPAAGNTEIFEELRALKELLDTDVLTLSEYYFEKEKMLKRIR